MKQPIDTYGLEQSAVAFRLYTSSAWPKIKNVVPVERSGISRWSEWNAFKSSSNPHGMWADEQQLALGAAILSGLEFQVFHPGMYDALNEPGAAARVVQELRREKWEELPSRQQIINK